MALAQGLTHVMPDAASTDGSPLVAVVVLNWNGWRDTLECLASLRALTYANALVVTVDNGSIDDSIERISQAHPGVELIGTGANLGFAGGNNVGIRRALEAGADYVLLLNNDTVVAPDLIEGFLAAQAVLPNAGVMGAKTYFYSEPTRIWYAGGSWSATGQCFVQRGEGEIDAGQYDKIETTGFVVGSAMFIPRSILERVGLLTEDYFLNYEEIDFGTRVQGLGLALGYAPDARVWHKVSASFGGEDSPLKAYFTFRNRLLWAERHLGWGARWHVVRSVLGIVIQRLLLQPIRPASAGEVAGLQGLRWRIASAWRSPVNRAVAAGVWDYCRRRFGPPPDRILALNKHWRELRAAL